MARLGFEPLVDLRFTLPFGLRLELQRGLFPFQSPEMDVKFYRWAFLVKPNYCEETGNALAYASWHVSHIVSRGARSEIRYDGRNFNLLQKWVHDIWDRGTVVEKKRLLIWNRNEYVLNLLEADYIN